MFWQMLLFGKCYLVSSHVQIDLYKLMTCVSNENVIDAASGEALKSVT